MSVVKWAVLNSWQFTDNILLCLLRFYHTSVPSAVTAMVLSVCPSVTLLHNYDRKQTCDDTIFTKR